MKHRCTRKGSRLLSYFRYDRVLVNEVYKGMAYGSYGICRRCESPVKMFVTVASTGAVKEVILRPGETSETKKKQGLSFTEAEAAEFCSNK